MRCSSLEKKEIKDEEEEEGEQDHEQNNEVILPYLRTLSVARPNDNNNNNSTMIQTIWLLAMKNTPNISRATRSLVSLVKSKDYFSSVAITRVTDDTVRYDIALTVQASL